MRGQKPIHELPPCISVSYAGATASIAIAPGMPPAELKSALLHLFRKELKGYGATPFDVVGVEVVHDEKFKELVTLDVLARAPCVAIAPEGESHDVVVMLIISPEMPPKKVDGFPIKTVMPLLICFALYFVRTLITRPFLRVLYRTGPAYQLGFGTVGFWEGAPLAAMCASLTGAQDAIFWEKNRAQCMAIFARKEEGFLIAVETTALLLAALFAYRSHGAELKKQAAALPSALPSALCGAAELFSALYCASKRAFVKPAADKPDPAQGALAKYKMHALVAAAYALGFAFFLYPGGTAQL